MSKPTVMITGAGIGIGEASALAFGRSGYHVYVTDVLDTEGEETVAAIEAAGGSAEFSHVDVTDSANVDAAVAAAEAATGALDAVVANAGIAHKALLTELSDETWDHTLDVDLKGVFRLLRAAAPTMREARRGAMVALSSVMGTSYGWHDHVQYNAAKAGVVGLVRGLACDLGGDGIRVNGVAPGFIKTAQALSHRALGRPRGVGGVGGLHPPRPPRRGRRHCRCRPLPLLPRFTLRERPDHHRRRRPHRRPLLSGLPDRALAGARA